jgi:hypothetical protein
VHATDAEEGRAGADGVARDALVERNLVLQQRLS